MLLCMVSEKAMVTFDCSLDNNFKTLNTRDSLAHLAAKCAMMI